MALETWIFCRLNPFWKEVYFSIKIWRMYNDNPYNLQSFAFCYLLSTLSHVNAFFTSLKCLICLISVIYLSRLIRSCKIDNEFFIERKLDYRLKETFILSLIAEIVIASQLKLASRSIFTKINVIGGTYE